MNLSTETDQLVFPRVLSHIVSCCLIPVVRTPLTGRRRLSHIYRDILFNLCHRVPLQTLVAFWEVGSLCWTTTGLASELGKTGITKTRSRLLLSMVRTNHVVLDQERRIPIASSGAVFAAVFLLQHDGPAAFVGDGEDVSGILYVASADLVSNAGFHVSSLCTVIRITPNHQKRHARTSFILHVQVRLTFQL